MGTKCPLAASPGDPQGELPRRGKRGWPGPLVSFPSLGKKLAARTAPAGAFRSATAAKRRLLARRWRQNPPAKRLEAIQIELTDEMAEQYDIYYRVHSQTYGWLGWAKNGESAGTEGQAKRLEAIEIQLVEKGGAAPGSTEQAFIKGE